MTPAEERALDAAPRLLWRGSLHIERTPDTTEEFVSAEPRREPMPLTCARGHADCTTPGACAIDAKYAARESAGREIDAYLESELEKRGTVLLLACGHRRKTLADVSKVAEAFCDVCGALRTIVAKWPAALGIEGEDEIERARRRAPINKYPMNERREAATEPGSSGRDRRKRLADASVDSQWNDVKSPSASRHGEGEPE